MNNLLLSNATKTQLAAFLTKPSHGLLITGPTGAGKYFLARSLAWQLLGLTDEAKLINYPYFHHVSSSDGKKEVSIDTIRELTSQLKLKTTGSSEIRRVAVIENAQLMSHEAQNALLKSLEEAPGDTVFILTSPSQQLLLPTIASRVQVLSITNPNLSQALKFYQLEPSLVTSAWQLSGGGVGLMSALLSAEEAHPLKQSVEAFKLFLKESRGDRLARVDKLEKEDFANFLDAGSRITAVLHKDAIYNQKYSQARRLLQARKHLFKARQQLANNAMSRLVALELVLGLEV